PHVRAFVWRSRFGLIIRGASGSVVSEFRFVVAGLDRFGAITVCGRDGFQNSFRVSAGASVGNDLFLWNVLVADLSDDPLRRCFSLAGLPAAADSGRLRFSFSGAGLRRYFASRQTIWQRCDLGSAACLGFVRLASLCDNGTSL